MDLKKNLKENVFNILTFTRMEEITNETNEVSITPEVLEEVITDTSVVEETFPEEEHPVVEEEDQVIIEEPSLEGTMEAPLETPVEPNE
jgi:hypothetical protein